MQQTSSLYRRIIADENHWFQTRVVVGESGNLITENGEKILFGGFSIIVSRTGPDAGYPENYIFSVKTYSNMLQNKLEIGKCIAQEIEVQMMNPSGDMPRMSVVVPYVRACNATQQSEWIQQGIFYIDTRQITDNNDEKVLTIHGYDAMMRGNQGLAESSISWPATDANVVRLIASNMGIGVDPRTFAIMTDSYSISYPGTKYTMLDLLGYIASMYLGSFIITETGTLRLISFLELPEETRYLIDQVGDNITFGGNRILLYR